MKITIIMGTTVGSKSVNIGEIHEVDIDTGRLLISQKQAIQYVAPQKSTGVALGELSQMKKDELLALAKEKGIDVPENSTKPQIIEILSKEIKE